MHASCTQLFHYDFIKLPRVVALVYAVELPYFLVTRIVLIVYYAMAVHGTLATFNLREEDWSEYVERLSFYFTANGITGDFKKRAILLSSVGQQTFCLMQSLILPASLGSFPTMIS